MKVLVCGDRNWTNYCRIFARLEELPKDTVIIEGGARGADALARRASEILGFTVIEMKADWARFGRGAGPIRNKEMLASKPDLVIAFHDNIESSRGTKHMVSIAESAGVPVEIVRNWEI